MSRPRLVPGCRALTFMVLALPACGCSTEPAVEPTFSVTATLPSGELLRLSGTSASWMRSIDPAGAPARVRMVLRATEAPASLGPPVDLILTWQDAADPLDLATSPLTDTSHVGVLFLARAAVGAWAPDSGDVSVTFADTLTIEGTFRAHLRPVYAVQDPLPHLAVTGTFEAHRVRF